MNPRPFHPEPVGRRGFSLVELLVVVSIMLVLMAMVGGGVAAARGSQKRQATQALIAKLDAVLDQQFATYASRSVPASVLTGTNKTEARGAYLRKLANAEMPDSWQDVSDIVSGSAGVPRTAPQNAYVGVYQTVSPNNDYGDAECLFMMVMQGGIADCLECRELTSSDKGDTDKDGAFEFLDAWGNPIRYVLWPSGLRLPPGSLPFFSSTLPFSGGTPQYARGGTMRPLIYSFGSANQSVQTVGSDASDVGDGYITNFDTEAAK